MEDLLYDAANTDPESTVPCRALRYRKDLLDCAHTTTDEATTVDGRDLEYQALLSKAREWRSRLFFSKRKLEELFTKDQGKVIKNLWTCPCGRCRRNRDEKNRSGPDQANERNRIAKKGWLLLALLVYLNRVHLIHSWVNKMENWNSGLLHGGMRNFDNPPCLDETYFSPKQLRWFKAKYCHDAALFDPEVFTSESLGREYNDDARFPFTTVKPLSQDAERFPSSDIVYDITIPAEYVDNWVKHKLRGYHDACLKVPNGGEINPENAASFRFAKKSQEIYFEADRQRITPAMVYDVHRMIQDSDHMITIVAIYEYRKHLHFVFHYVEGNLEHFLQGNWSCDTLKPFQRPPWAESKLWGEITGVCETVASFHNALNNSTRIKCIHFDLKPANLLITTNGVIKIADFGQCILIASRSENEAREVEYQPGDPKYRAPEAKTGLATRAHDVWQLACIILEVAVFMTFQTAGLSKFADRIPEEGCDDGELTSAFYCKSSEQIVGLKPCVTDMLQALENSGHNGSAFKLFLQDLVGLLRQMFSIDPAQRPTSSKVAEQLKQQVVEYRNTIKAEESYLLHRLARQRPSHFSVPTDTYFEVGWRQEHTSRVSSFKTLDEVRYLSRSSDGELMSKQCRLQLFGLKSNITETEESPRFKLLWAFGDGREDSDTDSRRLNTRKSTFIPLYLYDAPMDQTTNRWYGCIVDDGDPNPPQFEFRELERLLEFQSALLQHRVKYKESQKYGSVVVVLDDRKTFSLSHSVKVQLWTKQPPAEVTPEDIPTEYLSADISRSGTGSSGNKTGSKPVIRRVVKGAAEASGRGIVILQNVLETRDKSHPAREILFIPANRSSAGGFHGANFTKFQQTGAPLRNTGMSYPFGVKATHKNNTLFRALVFPASGTNNGAVQAPRAAPAIPLGLSNYAVRSNLGARSDAKLGEINVREIVVNATENSDSFKQLCCELGLH